LSAENAIAFLQRRVVGGGDLGVEPAIDGFDGLYPLELLADTDASQAEDALVVITYYERIGNVDGMAIPFPVHPGRVDLQFVSQVLQGAIAHLFARHAVQRMARYQKLNNETAGAQDAFAVGFHHHS